MKIHITAAPPGDGEEFARQALVGLTVPVPSISLEQPSATKTFDPVSNKLMPEELYYRVRSGKLLKQLDRTNPEAARYWRENAAWLLHELALFSIPASCCEVA